ncbi:MAG: histidinol dehydrogenase [Silicimonas sp.]|nr:histidinol dehydrogenase [Silicimonas sp.]
MPHILKTTDADFEAQFQALLGLKREDSADVNQAVAAIIADVRTRGDAAVAELTEKLDQFELTPDTLTFSEEEIAGAEAQVSAEEREALELAAERIRAYHEKQLPQDAEWVDETGAMLGWRWTPVSSAGLYVPGGLASYPSSVLMNAIPAAVAGVDRLVMTVPTPRGEVNPLVLVAAKLAGVKTIYRMGGAQAVAALAYGTDSIAPVDKITGPGNAYVAAAKRQVFGQVGIDMIAGPSEVLIIADKHNDPNFIALDLLSQAEHDESAQAILITNDATLADLVIEAVEAHLKVLTRRDIARASWDKNGAVILVENMGEAAALADDIAAEHLEILVDNPASLAGNIAHAGAIFLGAWTPEAIGDYVGGPNHVLPTARSARFSSGLSVLDFMKRSTIAQMTPAALRAIGSAAAKLAESESLEAHGLSVLARLDQLNS